MEHTWRWFGPQDPITLAQVRQTGATGVVTALHEVPNGQVWPVEAIAARKQLVEDAGLTWSVVESIPIHEDVKRGSGERDRYVEAWAQSVRNLAACGLDVVCYNFMPVLDWTRTDLAFALPDGTWALRFDADAFAAFDVFVLGRPGAQEEYDDDELARARAHYEGLDEAGREALTRTVIAGLPGAEEHYGLDELRAVLATYEGMGAPDLRATLASFLRDVVPVAEEVGVRLAIHPDDPPRPLLGLPRVVSTAADAQGVLDAAPSPANGLTFCTGSYGVRPDNDVVAMAERFAEHIFFAHLRSTRREANPASFHEAVHIDGDVDMVGVVAALVREERRREREGGPRLPMRPDHGHQMLDDQARRTNPGYSLLGRMKGLAELRGVELAVRRLLRDDI
ncbi:mannonate dehydratase [Cellulomonas bogoriensis]|uniref:Mannonate dehydratase n=1 Tax=Cellulomonas bogoriensis 69B4 = DSM 16987 TaxID=1386082 RepID=A0A0A0C0T1_9CELL|nr:mannonate dehydratase [Cellulomonas bogoriensis]KGM14223.1 mannonate dehydratase [Cellulomonas bogoriensis 69B4 = DSM 16987]